MPTTFHRGEDCMKLVREAHTPADCRCRIAIKRYAAPEYAFLNSSTWVPLDVAAGELGLRVPEVLRQAKAGELNSRPRASAAPRLTVYVEGEPREMTPQQAAKSLRISLNQLQQRIDDSEFETRYLDEHLEIEITVRWDYERCLLWKSAGICGDFEGRRDIL